MDNQYVANNSNNMMRESDAMYFQQRDSMRNSMAFDDDFGQRSSIFGGKETIQATERKSIFVKPRQTATSRVTLTSSKPHIPQKSSIDQHQSVKLQEAENKNCELVQQLATSDSVIDELKRHVENLKISMIQIKQQVFDQDLLKERISEQEGEINELRQMVRDLENKFHEKEVAWINQKENLISEYASVQQQLANEEELLISFKREHAQAKGLQLIQQDYQTKNRSLKTIMSVSGEKPEATC
ncbi:hypothetical protein FGO68_gene1809 [Halteria grandinella]|uniref:Uncharacterized protein n=1 Tax=Halteria grandinella TaxID=5974 RepID=A0A8J8NC00_HALGN|nr:hypothetical protein FGO68_gene1809 [Halteria grandinella]